VSAQPSRAAPPASRGDSHGKVEKPTIEKPKAEKTKDEKAGNKDQDR